MAWVYLLECADGSYYVGSTTNLDQRLAEHASGAVAGYTSTRLPIRLVWAEERVNVADAYALERKLHGWSRAKKRALAEGHFDLLPGLSSGSPARRTDARARLDHRDPGTEQTRTSGG